jgi:hypothetical protein
MMQFEKASEDIIGMKTLSIHKLEAFDTLLLVCSRSVRVIRLNVQAELELAGDTFDRE